MNVLYTSGYRKRFKKVIDIIKKLNTKKVTELCFGDTIIANYCHNNNIGWFGIDANKHFVETAKKQGFNAECADIEAINQLPASDVCIMIGSLYHFNNNSHHILQTMFSSSHQLIISEPIKNFSERKGMIGWLAHRLSNAGKGKEAFRYNETSLKQMLQNESEALKFTYEMVGFYKKDIIILLRKNEN